jgi:hypothetical protein
MISLCPLLPSNVNERGANKSLEIQIWWFCFYISCIVFSTICYSLCMCTLQMIFQCSNVAYIIFAQLCHRSNGFVNIKLAYIIAIKGWILTSTIFWLDICLSGTFCQAIRTTNVISISKIHFNIFIYSYAPSSATGFPMHSILLYISWTFYLIK